MADAPIDCVVVQFEDGRFHSELVSGLVDLVAQGTIRILDVVVFSRSADGTVATLEIDDLDDDARELFYELEGEYGGLLSDVDLRFAADLIAPRALGVALIWENTWTSPLIDGIRAAHGDLLLNERLSRPLVERSVAGS
jgi:hypothetical protein